MEFEDLSDKVKWEVRRVAAAFGVARPEIVSVESVPVVDIEGYTDTIFVEWTIEKATGVLEDVGVGPVEGIPCCRAYLQEMETGLTVWRCFLNQPWCDAPWECCESSRKLMVYGLYRLGIEDDEALVGFNTFLSAHEQIELRLSRFTMPKEFWPQKWLEETGHSWAWVHEFHS